MILEGIVTTRSRSGAVNIAPMGPLFDPANPRQFILKPFETSQTYQNLREIDQGVFHITDDVLLLAKAVIGQPQAPLQPAESIQGDRLVDCCRYIEFRVHQWRVLGPRAEILCDIVHERHVRDFFGWNRAKHAVIEAAILASRVGILPNKEILEQIPSLQTLVAKTGGPPETEAFDLLKKHIQDRIANHRPNGSDGASAHGSNRSMVRVTAASRLHLGFLSTPHGNDRAWGGIGVMVNEPKVEILARPRQSQQPRVSANASVPISLIHRVEAILTKLDATEPFARQPLPAIEIVAAPREHIGLGTGTQLTLAVAEAVARFMGSEPDPFGSPYHTERFHRRAVALGRGKRSAIGIHGFLHGGMIVDAGKLPSQETSPLLAVIHPPPWALLIIPPLPEGPHGSHEDQTIAREVTISPRDTQELSDRLLRRLMPIASDPDAIRTFGLELAAFNRLVGNAFARVQGGPYAHPLLQEIVDTLARDEWGASQSSWGPTLYVPTATQAEANDLRQRLATQFSLAPEHFVITTARKQGATVETRPLETENLA
jgi:beta-RFAP synthase